MTEYETQRSWSDRFIPQIKNILAQYLIVQASDKADMEQNTDLIVFEMGMVRTACRVRRIKYLREYPDDITIRCELKSGHKTELAKIMEGWGDYFFYAFADEDEKNIIAWVLCDFKVFRLYLYRYMFEHQGKLPGIEKPNKDKVTALRAFNLKEIPSSFVVARHRSIPVSTPCAQPAQNEAGVS